MFVSSQLSSAQLPSLHALQLSLDSWGKYFHLIIELTESASFNQALTLKRFGRGRGLRSEGGAMCDSDDDDIKLCKVLNVVDQKVTHKDQDA